MAVGGKLLFSTRSRLFKAGIILLSLATLDSLFTDFGLRHTYITEVNPL